MAQESEASRPKERQALGKSSSLLLLFSIFVIAACGLTYELLAGALASYLIGDSLWQFSLVIGLFLSAMGLGAFVSRFISSHLISTFITIEILVGLVGGVLPLGLFVAYAFSLNFYLFLVSLSLVVGTLVGLEIPLLVRILGQRFALKDAIGNVLSLDYLGGLAASLVFPLLLAPHLGMVRTGFLFGLLNIGVAMISIEIFRHALLRPWRLYSASIVGSIFLLGGLVTAGNTTTLIEDTIYDDDIIFTKTTAHQRIVLTRWRNDLRLFLNGSIQFSSSDEYRYHESLVHIATGALPSPPTTVLLLGGGDGLGAREVLKYSSVQRLDLVDIDPEITRLASEFPPLVNLNRSSLGDSRVNLIHQDAQKFLENSTSRWNLIIIDLPDPNTPTIARLYSRSFYRLVAKHLYPTGLFVTQATSPFYSRTAFWCIVNTIASSTRDSVSAPLHVLPLQINVPSFGQWGFVIASALPLSPSNIRLRNVQTSFLDAKVLPGLFLFPKDISHISTPINRVDTQVLLKLYRRDYSHYNQRKP